MKPFAAAVATAVLFATPQPAAQSGTAPYCLQTSSGTRCVFSTMGECEQADADRYTGDDRAWPASGSYRTVVLRPAPPKGR